MNRMKQLDNYLRSVFQLFHDSTKDKQVEEFVEMYSTILMFSIRLHRIIGGNRDDLLKVINKMYDAIEEFDKEKEITHE